MNNLNVFSSDASFHREIFINLLTLSLSFFFINREKYLVFSVSAQSYLLLAFPRCLVILQLNIPVIRNCHTCPLHAAHSAGIHHAAYSLHFDHPLSFVETERCDLVFMVKDAKQTLILQWSRQIYGNIPKVESILLSCLENDLISSLCFVSELDEVMTCTIPSVRQEGDTSLIPMVSDTLFSLCSLTRNVFRDLRDDYSGSRDCFS